MKDALRVVAGCIIGVAVLPEVDADDPRTDAPRQPIADRIEAAAVEAHPVDDRLILFESEQPRGGIARLRAGRHGPDLDKAETEAEHFVGNAGVLVVARGQSNRVREVETPQALRQDRRIGVRCGSSAEKSTRAVLESPQGQLVRGLPRQPAQRGADQLIKACHSRNSVVVRTYGRSYRSCREAIANSPRRGCWYRRLLSSSPVSARCCGSVRTARSTRWRPPKPAAGSSAKRRCCATQRPLRGGSTCRCFLLSICSSCSPLSVRQRSACRRHAASPRRSG